MYEDLYQENRGLLQLVARRFAWACAFDRAVSVEDLTQAGFIGLVKASESYAPDKGRSWASWAAWYISREIYTAMGYRWQPATEDDPGRYRATRAHTGARSLDAPLLADDPDGMTGLDALEDTSLPATDEALNLDNLRQYVRRAVERLQGHQEREVMRICGLEEKPYSAAAAALGVSTERVRQIKQRALKSLRRDKALRADARGDIAELDERTPYYARVTVTSFNRDHTSTTEKAVLWRLEQEQRRAAQIERLKRIEQGLNEQEAIFREKAGKIGTGGAIC